MNISLSKRSWFVPYLMILPALLLILLFKIYPIFTTLLESFIVKGQFTLQPYKSVFQDKVFWNAFWITIKLNLVMIPVQIVISFCLSLLSNVDIKGIGGFRTVFFSLLLFL